MDEQQLLGEWEAADENFSLRRRPNPALVFSQNGIGIFNTDAMRYKAAGDKVCIRVDPGISFYEYSISSDGSTLIMIDCDGDVIQDGYTSNYAENLIFRRRT